MKYKFKISHIIIASVNAAAIAASIVLTAVGGSLAKSQDYNLAYERWKGDNTEDFAQISCYFSESAGFAQNSVNSARSQLISALTDAAYDTADNTHPFIDAYSGYYGTETVRSDINGRANAEITAVGGDFFFFHDFELADGAYISDDDLSKDGAVIDRETAWLLYGSDDVAGMNLYIGNIQFYISGVIENPDTKADKLCADDTPKVYISYEKASELSGSTAQMSEYSTGFDKVTAYECIMPEPVENFGSTTFKKIIGDSYMDKVSVISNSERFTPKKRCKALKNIEKTVIHNDGIRYPAWENASRIVEFKLSYIYTARKYLLFLPTATLLFLCIKLFILWQKNKAELKKAALSFIRKRLPKKNKNTTKPTTERINLS